MNILNNATLAAIIIGILPIPGFAQQAEEAFRIRASIYANKKPVTTASWVGVMGRMTTVKQTFSTPYQRDIALNKGGTPVGGLLNGEVTMAVRPFKYRGSLCLDVEINIHTVSQLHHYRSADLLEVLPGGGGYSAGGDYCEYKKTPDGLLFSRSHGDDSDYGEILVAPEMPVEGAGTLSGK